MQYESDDDTNVWSHPVYLTPADMQALMDVVSAQGSSDPENRARWARIRKELISSVADARF